MADSLEASHNNYLLTGGNFAYTGGTPVVNYTTFTDWKTPSRDNNSTNVDPLYQSSILLKPSNNLLNNVALPIPYITTDIAGTLRSSTPDVGAYEFVPLAVGANHSDFKLLTIYPNPAQNTVSFDVKNPRALEISDVLGKQIIELNAQTLERSKEINVSSLEPGIYFVKIINQKNETFVGKFVKE